MRLHYFTLFLLLVPLKLSSIYGISPQATAPNKSFKSLPPEAFLSIDHYHTTCPHAEGIISQKVASWVKHDPTLAPAIIRLHFHDCAVRVIHHITQHLFKFSIFCFHVTLFFFLEIGCTRIGQVFLVYACITFNSIRAI